MYEITKERCLDILKKHYRSRVVFLSTISLFALGVVWFYLKNIFIVATAAVVLVVLCVIYGLKVKNRIKNISLTDFYLAEDVVKSFKKRFGNRVVRFGPFSVGRTHGLNFNYIYEFKKYGKYKISRKLEPTIRISLNKENDIDFTEIEELSSESCETGDMFYLLICEERGKKKILMAFYRYYFKLAAEDFYCEDGKYYCKD